MKASPFYTGQIIAGKTSSGKIVRWDDPEAVKIDKIFAHNIKAKMDDDRIYVWPIFYKNFLLYSILWPLAEINDVGWEVRPFVSVDNYEQEYRLLTGGWNSKTGSNYIFPMYVKDKKGFFSLPFSRLNDGKYYIDNYMLFGGYYSSDNSSYIFPLYYYDGTDETLYTLICSFSKDFGYIFPIYFYDRDYYQGGTKFSNYIIPPFGKFSYFSGEEESYIEEARFFPLFFYDRDKLTDRYVNPKYAGQKIKYKDRPKDYWLEEDSIEKSFTFFPLLYFSNNQKKNQNSSEIFPILFSGKDKYRKRDKEWFNIFPLYFSGSDKSYKGEKYARDEEWIAAIPFFAYGKDGKDYFRNYMMFAGNYVEHFNDQPYLSSYILPFYFIDYNEINHTRINSKYKGEQINWRNRPKDYYIKESTIAKNSFYFPSVFMTQYENKKYDKFSVFPFYFRGFDKRFNRDSEWLKIFPLYAAERDKENHYKNYCIMAGTRDEKLLDKHYCSSYFFPFYNYDFNLINQSKVNPKYKDIKYRYNKEPDDYYIKRETISQENFYFPGIFSEKYKNGDYEKRVIFPFYYSGHDKRYTWDKEWDTVFPLFSYQREEKDISKNYLCLTGTESKVIKNKTYESSYFIPFYYYGYSKDIDVEINPKYKGKNIKYSERPPDYNLVNESPRKHTYIFPNYYAEENKEQEESEFTIFPFVFYEKNKTYEETGTPFSVFHRKEYFHNDTLTSQFLWYLYYYERDQYDITEYIFPSYYSYNKRKRNYSYTSFFPFTFREKTDKSDSFSTFLWLYTSYSDLKQKKTERQAFWYLYYNEYHEANKEAKTEEYESSRILWKAYHRETKGKTTNIDIFPFISYSKNQERSKLSFAWRFFSVENSKKATKIHLFFIPVWW